MRSVFLGTKHSARAMKTQAIGGVIVNTASIAGLSGRIGPLAYSAAKAAVINFGRVVAVELAPHRIRVNTVAPGIIRTPLIETGKRDVAGAVASAQPWPALGDADHVARVVAFLCSEAAEFRTGANVVVDGGLMAAGPRIDQLIGSNPTTGGRVGVNRGSTGEPHTVRDLTALD